MEVDCHCFSSLTTALNGIERRLYKFRQCQLKKENPQKRVKIAPIEEGRREAHRQLTNLPSGQNRIRPTTWRRHSQKSVFTLN